MATMLYQLGDVPLFHTLVGDDGKGVSIDLGRSARIPQTNLTGVSGSVSYVPLTRPLLDPMQIKISGILRQLPPYGLTRSINSLKSLIGYKNIPVIGFFMENSQIDGQSVPNLLWLYANCTIKDVDASSDYNSEKDVWGFDKQPITITLVADLRWRSLSPWFWEYRDPHDYLINPNAPTNSQVGIDNYFYHPPTFNDLSENFYFFRWQSDLSQYNPTFWGIKYDSGLLGGVGSDFVDFGSHSFYSDPQLWSAQPTSVYAFTNLSDAGEINMTVRRQTGLFASQYIDEVSSLDLAQLNDDLITAGYSGLLPSDYVFTGYLSPFPGFVYRNGERLTGFTPRWSYPGTYPGETGRAFNTITITAEGTTGQVAYLHEYGVL